SALQDRLDASDSSAFSSSSVDIGHLQGYGALELDQQVTAILRAAVLLDLVGSYIVIADAGDNSLLDASADGVRWLNVVGLEPSLFSFLQGMPDVAFNLIQRLHILAGYVEPLIHAQLHGQVVAIHRMPVVAHYIHDSYARNPLDDLRCGLLDH